MKMFTFVNPYSFLLLVPLAAACWFIYRRRAGQALLFSATQRLVNTGRSWRMYSSLLFPALLVLGLILAIVAAARPRTVFARVARTTDAIGVMMVVDVSGSMDALDLSTKTATGYNFKSRLEVVKETFQEFVKKRPDDLLGLITFGGYAATRVPLTADHNLLIHVLKGVDIPRESTDQQETLTAIGDALATACARLEHEKLKSRIIVLLTDGVSNTGIIKPDEAIRAAKKLGLRIYTIGVGSTGWAPVAGRDIFGNKVITRAQVELDEELLKRTASETGGKYFNVRNPDGLQTAMAEINKLEKTEVNRDIFYNYNELFPWALLPGMALIVVSVGLNMLVTRRIA